MWRFGERWNWHDYLSRPVTAGGMVFIANNSGSLFALDALTGEICWEALTGEEVPKRGKEALGADVTPFGLVCAVGSMILVGDSSGCLRVYSGESGTLLRERQFTDSMLAVEHLGGEIWVSSLEGVVAVASVDTLTPRWQHCVRNQLRSPVIPMGDLALALLMSGELVALGRTDGGIAWTIGSIAAVARQWLGGRNILASTMCGELVRIDLATGETRPFFGRQIGRIFGDLVVDSNLVYVETLEGILQINMSERTVCRVYRGVDDRQSVSFAVDGEELYVFEENGGHIIAIRGGQRRWRKRVGFYDLT